MVLASVKSLIVVYVVVDIVVLNLLLVIVDIWTNGMIVQWQIDHMKGMVSYVCCWNRHVCSFLLFMEKYTVVYLLMMCH